jgi:glycosyltransferase involved in cell wall biosynthesis
VLIKVDSSNVRGDGASSVKRKKIAFISHTSIFGGAERALLEIVEGLSKRDFDCTVFLPSLGPLETELKSRGFCCYVLKYSWWSNPNRKVRRNINSILAVYRFSVIFRRQRYDVVYTNTMMIPSGALAAKICNIPHIWHIHEFGSDDHGLTLDIGNTFGRSLIGYLSSRVLCVSNAVRSKFSGIIPNGKLRTVYGAVNIPHERSYRGQPAPYRGVRCVLVGVLRPSKGQKEAVEAIALLLKDGFNVKLSLVGAGPSENELRLLIRDLEIDEHVELVGYVDNPFKYVDQADIVLMCSRCEAFARPVLEAMMMGKPIVGTRSGGTIEAVRDGFNGLLYTPGDAKDLAAKIKILGNDLTLATQFGANGRAWSRQEFTMDRLLDRVSESIDAVLYQPS